MKSPSSFVGSIPEFYDQHLVPAIFDPYAEEVAGRVPREAVRVLETACGSGVVTRRLLDRLSPRSRLVATDLNEAMIDEAKKRVLADPRLEWRPADGTALPFPDAGFDAVVCQFGVMFYPDKVAGAREARRVLAPGGTYLFDVWGAFAFNPFGRIAHETIARFFPDDPPRFYLTPFGYHDDEAIRSDLEAAGFRDVRFDPVDKPLASESAAHFAAGLVRGSPVSLDIAERGSASLDEVERTVAKALAAAGGERPFRSTMRALVVTARA